MEKCRTGVLYHEGIIDEECVTIGYSIIGDPTMNHTKGTQYEMYHNIMERVARMNGFKLGKDVKSISVG
jgi:hypothetical protein